MFQKFLLTIVAIFVGISWLRHVFARDKKSANQPTAKKKEQPWFKKKNTSNNDVEALEECNKCGVFFSGDGNRTKKICHNCQKK